MPDKLDAVEATPVGGDGLMAHRVFAAHWWGNAEVADAVLADMNATNATLDLRSPRQLAQASDIDLLDCFGVTQSNDFAKTVKALTKAHQTLKGLTSPATTACRTKWQSRLNMRPIACSRIDV